MIQPTSATLYTPNSYASHGVSAPPQKVATSNKPDAATGKVQQSPLQESQESQQTKGVTRPDALSADRLEEEVKARSTDGDTVQISESGQELSDSYDASVEQDPAILKQIIREEAREEEAKAELEEARREALEAREAARKEIQDKIATADKPPVEEDVAPSGSNAGSKAGSKAENSTGSYAGISDSQMKEMYLKGEISRYDYETEIKERKEMRESTAGKDQARNQQFTRVIRGLQDTSQTNLVMETAFADSAAEIPDIKSRLAMLDAGLADTTKDTKPDAEIQQKPAKNIRISVR